MYTASENDGFVEIGVVMTNPSTLGFDVILEYQTRRGTAGISRRALISLSASCFH